MLVNHSPYALGWHPKTYSRCYGGTGTNRYASNSGRQFGVQAMLQASTLYSPYIV